MRYLILALLLVVISGCASAFHAKNCKLIGEDIYYCQEKID